MCLVLLWGLSWAQPAPLVPVLAERVTDQTGMLDAARRQALDARLAALEQRKGAQLAVLVVATTQPDTIEQYATRVFDQWKLGRQGTDDGVLLLVAKNDRTLRIEVGYGLEGAISDALASRIIREQIVPRFQAGDFVGGIDAGVASIERLVDGEPLPPPDRQENAGIDADAWPFIGMAVLFLLWMPAIMAGVVVAIVAGFVSGSVWIALLVGAAGWASSALLGVLGLKRKLADAARRGGRGGGGFGGGGSVGRGGGFGGGGGRSGGGGASGRW